MYDLFNDDCYTFMEQEKYKDISDKTPLIITDPPFNVGYHYRTYKDSMDENKYFEWLSNIFGGGYGFIIIHYPEALYKISQATGVTPSKVVSWVYNSNTAKQHRDIGFFNISPDFNLVRQPYKNPTDKRIRQRIAEGHIGGRLYDWWNVNQVKNVSKVKTLHPCQMPQEVMDNIVGIIPNKERYVVIDTFMGSGTTGISCLKYGVDFIGIEIDEEYFKIAKDRIENATFQTSIFDCM